MEDAGTHAVGGHRGATLDTRVELAGTASSCVNVAGSRATLAALSRCHVVCIGNVSLFGLVGKLLWPKSECLGEQEKQLICSIVQERAGYRVFIKDFVHSQALVGSVLYLTSVLSSTHHRSFFCKHPTNRSLKTLQ